MIVKNEAPQLRPATIADLDAVYTLIAQQNSADFGSALLSSENLRQRWQDAEFSLATQTQVAFSADGQLRGYAEIRPYQPNQFLFQLYLAPAAVSHEIGQQLIAALEANLPSGTQLMNQTGGTNLPIQEVLTTAGFAQGLTFLMMEIELTEPPPKPVWPEGIVVRPFQPHHDEQATYATDEAASRDKGYAHHLSFEKWARRMNLHSEQFDPTLWFLACHEEEVVGVALNLYLPEQACGVIDHLGVQRQWRGQGIGLALLRHSFATFFARGITRLKLNVDSGSLTNAPRLYEKAGMKTVHSYHIFSKTIS